MMADNPVYYYREHPCTEFIASVPTTWDELRVLRARCGEQVVMARRKGDRWFIGGITNNQPYSTEVALCRAQLYDDLVRGRCECRPAGHGLQET